jgi:tyrosyl-tRNA synthetase
MRRIPDAILPTIELTRDEIAGGVALVDVIVEIGFAKSKSEARRLITQGAVRLTNSPSVAPGPCRALPDNVRRCLHPAG